MYEVKDLTGEKSVETVDEGLRQYMIKIFNYMGAGLCITALAAWVVVNTPLLTMMYSINEQTHTASLSTNFFRCFRETPASIRCAFDSTEESLSSCM